MQDHAALPWLWRELGPSGGGLAGKDYGSAAAGISAGGGQGQGPSRLLSSLGGICLRTTFWKWEWLCHCCVVIFLVPQRGVGMGSSKIPEGVVKSWFTGFWGSGISWLLFATTTQICFIKSGCVFLCYKVSCRCWVESKGGVKPQQECGMSSCSQFYL